MAINLIFDGVWMVISDPLSLFQSWSSQTRDLLRGQLPIISQVIGAILVFIVVNLAMYTTMKFAAICVQIKKALELFLDLPILLLFRSAFAKIVQWMIDAAKMGKEKDKPDEDQIKEMRSEMKSDMDKIYAIIEGLSKAIPINKRRPKKKWSELLVRDLNGSTPIVV